VVTLVVIIGTLMYVVEGEEHVFTDIPTSIYWAVVTLTTVGYGDLALQTALGKALASIAMLLGCGIEGHDADAVYCNHCGSKL
jgi:voltage-gated potassium channel